MPSLRNTAANPPPTDTPEAPTSSAGSAGVPALTAGARFADVGSRHYGILLASMAVIVILSNIGASKGVLFGPIVTDGGFFLFPFAYILGDVISEIYGFKMARKAILTTFALSVFASLSYWVIIALPGFTDDYGIAKQAALVEALGPVPQIVLASLLAFLVGQTINSQIMVRLKARQGERKLWMRLMGSSGVGEFFDTLIFCLIAAPVIGIVGFGMFANYVIVGFVYKVGVQYALIPVTTLAIGWFKRHEPTYPK
ncbi:queuosine precursor transporter [Arthrobacter cryoconiti]|uniref:Probable queuosine precursor transporter n=1 Tax=Arthrobacter cryoconiti TaxID=748907 RepID=A0ABV8R0R6_9MICC|nr:queuosine precursor transporter [Arthrobacter cryoconiti]MCC9067663.1 queuosine precursor transporter [Arthrobacter cryoconiti]